MRTGMGGWEMTVEELIVMLREDSDIGSEEEFEEAAAFLETFYYTNKEYRKEMTAQVARIEELNRAVLDLAQYVSSADLGFYIEPETRKVLNEIGEKKDD